MATPKPPSMNRQRQNVQHVREVPSYPESYDPANPYAKDDLNTPNEPKVTGAIEAMKNVKAANVDSIHAEMLKAGLNTSTKVFVDLIRPI